MRVFRPAYAFLCLAISSTSAMALQNAGCQTQNLAATGQQIATFRLSLESKGIFSQDQIDNLVSGYQDTLLASLQKACNQTTPKPAAQPVQQQNIKPLLPRQSAKPAHTAETKPPVPTEAQPAAPLTNQNADESAVLREVVENLSTSQTTAPGANQQNASTAGTSSGAAPADQKTDTTTEKNNTTTSTPKPKSPYDVVISITSDNLKEVKLCTDETYTVTVALKDTKDTKDKIDYTGDEIIVDDQPDDPKKTQAMKIPAVMLDKMGHGKITLTAINPGPHHLYLTLINTAAVHQANPEPVKIDLTIDSDEDPNATCIYRMPPLLLSLVGVDVESASSTSPQATFLGNVTLDLPVSLQNGLQMSKHSSQNSKAGSQNAENGSQIAANDPPRITDINQASRMFVGGSLRIAGMAQPGSLSAAAFTSGNYYASAINATPDKIVQSWEGVGSLSYRLWSTGLGIGTFDNGTPPDPRFPRTTLVTTSLLLSGGFISPLSASQQSPSVFYATNQIQNAFKPPQYPAWPSTCAYTAPANPTCYVAFIPEDRARFYRHYETGLRFKIYGNDFEHNMMRFPGILDVTAGQNEYVTGGGLKGVVVHLGGVLPFPIPVKGFDGIYIFGSMDSAINGPRTSCVTSTPTNPCAQLLLSPVPSTANVTYLSSSVYDVTVPQPNRDRYRFGFGIDIYHLLTAKSQAQKAQTSGGNE